MSLRLRKAGLGQRQQIQNTSFRLRKPKRRHVDTNRDEQTVFTDITTSTLSAENILLDGPSTLNANDLNASEIPSTPPLYSSNLEFPTYNSVPENMDQNSTQDQLFNDEMEYYNFINEYISDDEMDSEQDEYEENEFTPKQCDGSNKMFTFSGKAGPYFPNYTHFLLFVWVTKHQIGTYLPI
jgi:hypothetical protein